ncbi:MAG: M20/M25/M40 family metallo-hydrolase [Candidatus Hodarchaeales archaeon]|jgi:acetylornithine deacetylase/succinyl-diaminopimelate desuccinylase-like protein
MVAILFSDLLTRTTQYESRVLDILKDLVRFPTVAFREPEAIAECASYLVEILQKHGYKATQYPTTTDGSPVVFAEKDVGAPKTLMFYHHYDVQPEDPIDLWVSSPWELTERSGRVFGRGAVDNKGHIAISIVAIQLLEDQMKLPVNIKFVIEGEEEAGSNNLPQFAKPHTDLLKADGCVWEGMGLYPKDEESLTLETPVEIWCGLKGDAYFDLRAGGPPKFPRTDVHSGSAAAVPHAAWRLVWALNTLKDNQENILVEGFNDSVTPPLKEDLEALQSYEGDWESSFKRNYGLDQLLLNRSGTDLLVHLILEPSLTICGLTSGFQEPGSKTIVPAEASAKLDFRLVPNLTIEKVDELLRTHLVTHGFDDLEVSLVTGYDSAKTPVSHPFIRSIRDATRKLITPTPVNVIPFAPGSGPAYLFTPYTPLCMVTNNVEGLNGHAPNENLPLNTIKPSLAYNAFIAQLVAEIEL